MSDKQVMILDQGGEENRLYNSWSSSLTTPCVYLDHYDTDWAPPSTCGLIVTTQQYKEPEFGILRKALGKGTPILIIADGILEYRNTWIHPDTVGCIFQPVVGDKLACLGRSQARVVESWGNLGKCEVVGAPRLDPLIGRRARAREPGKPFRVLTMTAKMPGFTPTQLALAKRSLQDLKFWYARHQDLHGNPIEPVWRLTQGLDSEIGVKNHLNQLPGNELAAILSNVDAVITTPSTSMVESMLCGLPTALLDYNNCPHYVPSAWTISAPRHIDDVLIELFNPPQAKMLYQDTILHDALECRTPATSRMIKLIEEMLRIAHDCRAQNTPVAFPRRILTDPQDGHHLPEQRFDMKALYPEHPVFAEMDRNALQVELEILKRDIRTLRNVLKADNFLREMSKSFPGPRKLLRLWRESRRKVG